jgi:amidase
MRRSLLALTAAVGLVGSQLSPASAAPRPPFVVEETTIADIHAAFADKSLTCAQLVDAYLQRIAAYDNQGPAINALISVAPDAMAQARRLDQRYRSRGPVGSLHCIPVVLKDNIDTTDMPTTAGSLSLAADLPTGEATITTALRNAGAIIIAKGNLDEWAHGGANGYSSAGGRTFSPYGGSPGGSSGGPGAAIAANFGVIGVGSDTLGSIRGPAQNNSLAGVKPTMGLVSGNGIVPFALTFDVAGPITRTVMDAAKAMNVLAAVDPADPRTAAAAGKIPADYTAKLSPGALQGVRVGVVRTYFDTNANRAVLDQALADMAAAGAVIVDGIQAPTGAFRTLSADYYQLISETEFVAQLEDYLLTRRPNAAVRSHADVLAAALDPSFPIAPEVLVRLQRESTRGTLADPAYLAAKAFAPAAMRAGIDQMIDANDVDVLIHTGASQLESFSGYPSVMVHAGYTATGSPVSLQFLGKAFSEPDLLAYGYAYEQASMKRVVAPNTPPLVYGPPIGAPPGCKNMPAGKGQPALCG